MRTDPYRQGKNHDSSKNQFSGLDPARDDVSEGKFRGCRCSTGRAPKAAGSATVLRPWRFTEWRWYVTVIKIGYEDLSRHGY